MKRVVYIINYAPDYRNTFLEEFAKYVDLTVVSFNGATHDLRAPDSRSGYRYIELSQRRLVNISLNIDEYRKAKGDYDVIIIGYNLRNPFRLLNLWRGRTKPVILEGIIYGRANNWLVRAARRFVISKCNSVLVYSQLVKDRLKHETRKPIISFNNTSYSERDIKPLSFRMSDKKLNIIWVGRYQKRKKVERLVELARRDSRVAVRLIGPGIREEIALGPQDRNIEIYQGAYGDELEKHFQWSHAVFNTGGAGLLVMNAARFGRPIVIDNDSYHGPEIQLAKDADQLFVNFSDNIAVSHLIDQLLTSMELLITMGNDIANEMRRRYTVEFMARQYMKAVNGDITA